MVEWSDGGMVKLSDHQSSRGGMVDLSNRRVAEW